MLRFYESSRRICYATKRTAYRFGIKADNGRIFPTVKSFFLHEVASAQIIPKTTFFPCYAKRVVRL